MKTLKEKVDFKILVRKSRLAVFDAMTNPKKLDQWFASGAILEGQTGGAIRFLWKDWGPDRYTGENGGTVVEFKPAERFVFNWRPDSSTSYFTTVEMDFRLTADGTVVSLTEQGFEDSPTGLHDLISRATGWGEALTLLKFFVEHGVRY